MSMDEGDDDTDDPESGESSWAEPSTLLGMIQRGRGACLRDARAQPAVAGQFVVDCIVRDPRWDRQVEQRGWLYATLVADLGVDLSRLCAAYSGPADPYGDADAWLATGVLGLLARRGVDGAVTELRHYLRSGRDLDQALDALIPFIDHPEAEGLLDEVLEVADDEQLESALTSYRWFDLSRPPWPDWRGASARIERVIAVAEQTRAARERPVFDRAAREAAARERVLRAAIESDLITAASASELTEERWETTLLAIAPDLLQESPSVIRIAVRRCLKKLRSPHALTWARANAALDGAVAWAALRLFADVAETSDAPWLLELLTEAVARGNDYLYQQYDLVAALGRLDHVAGLATVEGIFDNTVYSVLRKQCAMTLSRLAPDFAEGRAVECLDDCESETREFAVAHADMSAPEVCERIGRMADDPTEDDDNRRAAAARILQRR
ncbi:hypothetical protein [Nocardia arthritidis]|uniref:HEAT repeat domain-containing protein n=1 Tax=Nocardia arthritidis TaxID=228602 RepID=A0A6G9YG85_9NOCA|nr:hypothetical protein [Nocardia arthritidis]QIS12239.1 hypothetical protein F5544_21885 [Nocardia arthritidis]